MVGGLLTNGCQMAHNTDDSTPEARVRASFARQQMMATLGAHIDEVQKGYCCIHAPILDLARQQHGYGHAALTFAVGDSAAGYAALSLLDEAHEVVTAEMKISLMAPARGARLEAQGRVLRPGKRLLTVQADVYACDGDHKTHIAVLLGTMVAVPIAQS